MFHWSVCPNLYQNHLVFVKMVFSSLSCSLPRSSFSRSILSIHGSLSLRINVRVLTLEFIKNLVGMSIRIALNIHMNLGIIGIATLLNWLIAIFTILGELHCANLYQKHGIAFLQMIR